MRFASIGSGSRGNGTLVQAGRTQILVDCGFGLNDLERRLSQLDTCATALDAVLVTHEHTDHIRGVMALARRFGVEVWMTAGTRLAARRGRGVDIRVFSSHQSFVIGDLAVHPYPVPHDAREPAQFVFDDGQRRLGLLTDAGHVTPHMQACLQGLDGLLLECNHDRALLDGGPYPLSLKRRVGGRYGHLSNTQSAQLLAGLDQGRLRHVVALHLSQENNQPDLARAALAEALNCAPDWVAVADQDEGLCWRSLD